MSARKGGSLQLKEGEGKARDNKTKGKNKLAVGQLAYLA